MTILITLYKGNQRERERERERVAECHLVTAMLWGIKELNKSQVPYSQHSISFVTYESAQ